MIRANVLVVAGLLVACSASAPAVRAASLPDATVKAPVLEKARAALLSRYGEPEAGRIDQGLRQVAALWRPSDGDLTAFAVAQFIPQAHSDGGDALMATFDRFEQILEQVDGNMVELGRETRRASELDVGVLLPVDALFGQWAPAAHVNGDFFATKIAFVALLNFPLSNLTERLAHEQERSRLDWAHDRLTARFSRRIPSDVDAEISKAGAEASRYIDAYNLYMHHVLGPNAERPFPKGMRLVSHWNLRDELKADYADKEGPLKQRMILQVMARIVTQSIPEAVVNNPALDWNPFTQAVTPSPARELEPGVAVALTAPAATPEPCTRFRRLLDQFNAARRADPTSPVAPTAIARSFEDREMSELRVTTLLKQILEAPVVLKVAAEIERRLGRKLAVQDLWYSGFAPRGALSEPKLNALTRARYPNVEAFTQDVPRILAGLGFSPGKVRFLASHIRVDPARGAGHALPAGRRGDFPHLRTRFEPGGMDYKGYNIAIHELGHNVEQVFSLYEVDHTLLSSVPNNAFTEALAFLFQSRDLQLLGVAPVGPDQDRLRVLNDFWQTWEIAGVGLLDVSVWHWMYDHPAAQPEQLRDAVVKLSQELWNRYYAPVLGGRDTVILGIYSHMIAYPLYLSDYPLGLLISAQIEEHLKGRGPLGPEYERMARFGRETPDAWMRNATGAPVGAEPLLKATEAAVQMH